MESLVTFLQRALPLLLVFVTTSQALKISVEIVVQGGAPAPPDLVSQAGQNCSRTCESVHCTIAPVMRYGKYCGVFYSGCPGEKPCDALDACCMLHDHCVDVHDNDYLNTMCNQNLLDCIDRVKQARRTFPGNTCDVGEVASVIRGVIEPAVLAGKILHKGEVGE